MGEEVERSNVWKKRLDRSRAESTRKEVDDKAKGFGWEPKKPEGAA